MARLRSVGYLAALCALVELCALAVFPNAARAQWSVATLGDQGERIEVKIAAYDDLFPGSAAVPAANRVMALEVTPAGGTTTRLLVPGTEGPERENRPSLVYDSGQLFVLWASLGGGAQSQLHLIGWDGIEFSRPMEISGDPGELKGPPRLALSRDLYGSAEQPVVRTTVHLLWWEQRGADVHVLYSPIVLVDGDYLGWNPVVDLGIFDSHDPLSAPTDALELSRAVTVATGAEPGTVVVALPRAETGRLLTLSLRLLPSSLRDIGDAIRAHIIGAGRGRASRSAVEVATEVRQEIESSSARLHAGVLSHLADQAVATVFAAGSTFDEAALEALAPQVGQSVVDAGASLIGNTLRTADLPCKRLALGPDPARSEPVLHELDLCLASDRALPETDPLAAHMLFVSEDAAEVLVAWVGDDRALHYRQSDGDAWSDTLTVATGDSLSIEQALGLLRRQIRLD